MNALAALQQRVASVIHNDLTTQQHRRDLGLFGIVPRLTEAVLAELRPELAAVERVRRLHVRNANTGDCEHCSERDYPDYSVPWPCPTIHALGSQAPVGGSCTGFPDRCPNLRAVEPDPPQHGGGVRCGCADNTEEQP